VLLPGSGSGADSRDGNALLKQCTATIGAEMAFCYGYIDGLADLLSAGGSIDDREACIPSGADDVELKNVVVRFLRHNPALGYRHSPELVARALSEAFRCR
jgi:Ssp1 endopeptidase immunity protein Rap1a